MGPYLQFRRPGRRARRKYRKSGHLAAPSALPSPREPRHLVRALQLPLVGVFQLADGITSVSMGILRGSGLASLGARINICAYWVVGLPLGLALTFSSLHWQLSGLWTGLAVALAVTAAASSVVIYNIDWQKAIVQAQHRTGVTPRRDDVWEA